jgi:hypothetical protein
VLGALHAAFVLTFVRMTRGWKEMAMNAVRIEAGNTSKLDAQKIETIGGYAFFVRYLFVTSEISEL